MQLNPLHLPLKPGLGGGEGAGVSLPPQTPGEGGELGGDGEAVPLLGAGVAGKTAEQRLAAAVEASGAVGVGRVEEQQAPFKAAPEGGGEPVVIPGRVVAPEELVAPGPGAYADAGFACRACHDGWVLGLSCVEFSVARGSKPPGDGPCGSRAQARQCSNGACSGARALRSLRPNRQQRPGVHRHVRGGFWLLNLRASELR